MPEPVGSPLWWVERLHAKLMKRRDAVKRYGDYYRGYHPLPDAPVALKREFLDLAESARTNLMRLVIESQAQRFRVQGFREGGPDSTNDSDAWDRLWQPNNLDAESRMVHREALISGISYVLVWADPDDPETPLITPEHPLQMIVEYDHENRRKRAAALKVWEDEWTGDTFATLYLPDRLYKFLLPEGSPAGEPGYVYPTTNRNGPPRPMGAAPYVVAIGGSQWRERERSIPNPLDKVPVVPFRNRPDMLEDGFSELRDLIPIQDRINRTVFSRSLAEWLSAYRQKWITGMEIPIDPATGQAVEPFQAAIDRLWMSENPDVRFGEFAEHNLKNYIETNQHDLQQISVIAQVPAHYLLGSSGNFPSGESLKATEAGLTAKVKEQQEPFADSWAEVKSLGYAVLDDPRSKVRDSTVVWANPEYRTEGELVDALLKMATLGVPNRSLWERWGASPQEMDRWEVQQADQVAREGAASLNNLFRLPTADAGVA